MSIDPQLIPAGEFKAHCLKLMDEVQAQRKSIIITKRGKPIAKLVPYDDEAPALVERALGAPGTKLVELSPAIALESSHLPGTLHGDPADRMIVATARRYDALLVTRDQKLLDYGRCGFVNVIGA